MSKIFTALVLESEQELRPDTIYATHIARGQRLTVYPKNHHGPGDECPWIALPIAQRTCGDGNAPVAVTESGEVVCAAIVALRDRRSIITNELSQVGDRMVMAHLQNMSQLPVFCGRLLQTRPYGHEG